MFKKEMTYDSIMKPLTSVRDNLETLKAKLCTDRSDALLEADRLVVKANEIAGELDHINESIEKLEGSF